MAVNTLQVRENGNGMKLFPILLLILFATIWAITYASHAVERHGIGEVATIRNCMRSNGPYQTWRSTFDPNKFFHICLLPDGRYGLQIVVDEITECIEQTCFIKGDGSFRAVVEYLRKFATRFKGKAPY